jgi:NADPH-dependent glutamate synthase beta subunit-like oxidoreductase
MPDAASPSRPHLVAVIGGATAGAEVAGKLAEHGARVVVFDMNPRPFGKIEDGLPRWHVGLREKEYETITEKLSRPGVEFVPCTKIGRDLPFEAIAREWGFSAVVLANGAWRDRPLPVEGADAYLGKGLVYQNPFIIWFNHADEAGYAGERFTPLDDALVVGGGLASIDVAKVLMLETTRAKLKQRGIELDMVELEVRGIPKQLEKHGLRFEDLGLRGCTLFYRRRVEDMPLAEIPEDADEKRREKTMNARRRLLEKAQEKYGFRVEPLCAPEGLLVEGGRVVGLRLRRTKMEGGKLVTGDETFERRGSCVISSIGSIPEPIPGIPMKGELFAFTDWDVGRLDGYPSLFSVGNVVTGKGNIVASRKHAAHVYEDALASFLGLAEDGHAGEATLPSRAEASAAQTAGHVAQHLASAEPPSAEVASAILARVRERQRAVGYDGDLAAWLAKQGPGAGEPR